VTWQGAHPNPQRVQKQPEALEKKTKPKKKLVGLNEKKGRGGAKLNATLPKTRTTQYLRYVGAKTRSPKKKIKSTSKASGQWRKKKTQQSLPDPPVPTSLAKKKDKLEECQKEKKKKVRMKLSTSWREGHPWY